MTKHYKNNKNELFGFEEGDVIPDGLTEIEMDDVKAINESKKPPLSQEELARQAKATGEIYALNGVDYQVPFMKDDADGLLQVKAAFDLGVTDTVIHFTNGTKMPITASEFQDFAVWFVTKRNNFFIGGN